MAAHCAWCFHPTEQAGEVSDDLLRRVIDRLKIMLTGYSKTDPEGYRTMRLIEELERVQAAR